MKGASGMHFEVHVRGGDGCCDSFVARGDTLEQAVEYAREWIKPKTKTKGEEIAEDVVVDGYCQGVQSIGFRRKPYGCGHVTEWAFNSLNPCTVTVSERASDIRKIIAAAIDKAIAEERETIRKDVEERAKIKFACGDASKYERGYHDAANDRARTLRKP
jgi:hypothetical protein